MGCAISSLVLYQTWRDMVSSTFIEIQEFRFAIYSYKGGLVGGWGIF